MRTNDLLKRRIDTYQNLISRLDRMTSANYMHIVAGMRCTLKAMIDNNKALLDDNLDDIKEDSDDVLEAAKRYATEGDEISGECIIQEEVEAFKAGSKWKYQQMIKNAIEATVHGVSGREGLTMKGIALTAYADVPDCNFGDKMKIYLFKEK